MIKGENMIIVKDANGKFVPIKRDDLIDLMIEKTFNLWGMSMEAIIEFQTQYEIYGGQDPITPESIKQFFQTKIKNALE